MHVNVSEEATVGGFSGVNLIHEVFFSGGVIGEATTDSVLQKTLVKGSAVSLFQGVDDLVALLEGSCAESQVRKVVNVHNQFTISIIE